MQIKLCQVMAGPLGVTPKGETIEVAREQGVDMVRRGLAIAVEPSPLAAATQAVVEAVANVPKQLAAPFKRQQHQRR